MPDFGREVDIGEPQLVDNEDILEDVDPKVKGKSQTHSIAVTSPANQAGDTLLATVTTQPVIIDKVVVYAVAAQTADMTSAEVNAAAGKVVTIIDSVNLSQSDVDAEGKQVSWTGAVYLPVGATLVMVHTGTGATALNLIVLITYHAAVTGGYLA